MDKPADKAREQMRSMGLSAPFIGSKETRTEEEVKQDRKTLAENVPILGEAIIAKEIADDVKDKNYLSAGLNTLALGVGAVPVAGDILNKPIRAAAKKLRKVDKDAATKMLSDVDSIETWKKQNPNPKPQKQNPDVEKSANDLLEGKITGKQHRSVVKENMPIVKIDEVPEMPSFTEIVGALDKDKSAKGILGLNKSVKDGTRVSSRLDIPAYERFDKWVVSVHDAFDKKGRESLNGDIIGYGKTAILKNVDFKGLPQGAANIAAKRNPKGTIARIFGDYYNAEPENVAEYAKQVIKNKNWTQVGYNPFRHGFFYDKNTGMPVKSAEEVIQVGPLVLAKNAKKIKISEAKQVGPKGGLKIRTGKPIEGLQNLKETKTVFNKGGAVPMNSIAKQMDMFEEGGLMDEGGTVDPVSGNDVPPGSTQEEVRDDIPAQLSEGEFVFPADVVRYFGLEKLMEMRQEAKAGLARMEAMGQMGNSEEATLPDDIPFSIEDLDMEDEDEYNTPQEFAYGGIVQMPGTNYTTTPNPGPTTGFRPYVAPTIPGSPPPVQTDPQYQGVQLPGTQFIGSTEKTNIPTFTQTIGTNPGQYDEFRTYVNSSGQTLQIPFKNGQPLYPIPQGYTLQKEDAVKTESTVPTTTVGQDEGGDGEGVDVDTTTVGSISGALSGLKSLFDKDDTPKVRSVGDIFKSAAETNDYFGGSKAFGFSNEELRGATFAQAGAQMSTFGLTGLVTNITKELGITNFSMGDIGTAGNTARNQALNSLGLTNIGQLMNQDQATLVGSAMAAAHAASIKGKNTQEAINSILNNQQAVTLQDKAYDSLKEAFKNEQGIKGTLSNKQYAVELSRIEKRDIDTYNRSFVQPTTVGLSDLEKAAAESVYRSNVVTDKTGKPVLNKNVKTQEIEPVLTSQGKRTKDLLNASIKQARLNKEEAQKRADYDAARQAGTDARVAQQEAIAKQQQERITSGQYSGVDSSQDFSDAFGDDGGSGGFSDSDGDTGPGNEGSGGISDSFGGGDYKGAFVGETYKKNKLAKQMKRSGLASKK